MLRPVVLGFVLAGLLGGGWLMLRSEGDGATLPTALPSLALATSAAVPELLEPAAAPVESTVVREHVAVTPDATPFPADAQWIEVKIVDAVTKQPVPGADVRWIDESAHAKVLALPERQRPQYYADQELLAQCFGRQTQSDRLGLARVTTSTDGVAVFATSGSCYGTTHCPKKVPPEGHQLELREEHTLQVQVLDARGAPAAGVQVRVNAFGENGKLKNISWIPPVLTKAPDGLVRFRHLQDWLVSPGSASPGEVVVWRVMMNVPGLEDPGVPFDRLSPPRDPIVLRLPVTGRIKTRLLHQGRPWVQNVQFSAIRGGGNSQQRNSAQRFVPEEDGWAALPHVPLGLTLNVHCSASPMQIDRTVDGPTGDGQEVAVEFTTDDVITLAGRFLGPDGKLLGDARVLADFDVPSIAGGGSHLRTDGSGRFHWFLGKPRESVTRLTRLELSLTPAEGPALRATVSPRDLVAGINDLGDVQLRCEPLVVAGRFQWDPPDEASYAGFRIERLGASRGHDGSERWEKLAGVATTERPDRSFEVRGETTAARHRLCFTAYNNLPIDPVEFRVGEQDLVIKVVAGSQLAANLLLPERLSLHMVRAVLRPNGPVPKEPPSEYGSDRYTADTLGPGRAQNELSWRALPPGTFTLEVRVGGGGEPLVAIDEVVVPPPSGGDPRLVGIDLRDKVRTVTVRVAVAASPGARKQTVQVFPDPQEGAAEWEGFPATDGELVLPAPLRSVELLVVCSGQMPKRVTVPATQAEVGVQLEPWPTLQVTIADPPQLPEGIVLQVGLYDVRPKSKTHYRVGGGSGPIDGLLRADASSEPVRGGSVSLPIGEGTFRISALLTRKGDRRPRSLRTITPNEVVGGPTPVPITIRLSADEVRAAIEEMQ